MKRAVLVAVIALAACVDEPTGGLAGTVTVGPTCPVEQDPPDPGCEDRPLAVRLDATQGGRVARSFSSDEEGAYRVALPPGTYEIRSSGPNPPTCHAGPVDVAHAFVRLDMACDSGIR